MRDLDVIAGDRDTVSFEEAVRFHPRQAEAWRAMRQRKEAIVLAGGSGYGGKSYLLRASAIGWHMLLKKWGVPKPVSVFASATYESLRDRHFRYFGLEYGDLGEVINNDKEEGRCFRFFDPAMGKIAFRNLADPGERRGTEFCAGFLDETTEITRETFGDFCYMVRRPGLDYRPILTATNPDGIGHGWCKALWRPHLNGLDRSKKFDVHTDPSGYLVPDDYIYVPFLPDDNPTFDEATFWRMVGHLPPHVQEARRWGRWDSPEGARFGYIRPDVQTFELSRVFPHGIPLHWPRIISIDYGLRAPYCALWHAIDFDGNPWTYRCDYQAGLTADAQAQRVIERTDPGETIECVYLDPSMWANLPSHQGPTDISTADMYQEAFDDAPNIGPLVRGYNRSRVHGLSTLDKLLRRENGYPDWFIEGTECAPLWTELEGAQFKKGSGFRELSEDLDERCPDHGITASIYGLHTHLMTPEVLQDRMLTPQQVYEAVRLKQDKQDQASFEKFRRRQNRQSLRI